MCTSPQLHSMTTLLSKPPFDTFALTCVPQVLQARRCKILSKSTTFKSICSAFLSVVTALGMTVGHVNLAAGGVSQPKELPETGGSVSSNGALPVTGVGVSGNEELSDRSSDGRDGGMGHGRSDMYQLTLLLFLLFLSFFFPDSHSASLFFFCIASDFFEAFSITDKVNARYCSRKKRKYSVPLLINCLL